MMRVQTPPLRSAIVWGVVFFDDLLAYYTAANLGAAAFLEGLGLLGLARGRCLPIGLFGGGTSATDERAAFGGLAHTRVLRDVRAVFACVGFRAGPVLLGFCGRPVFVTCGIVVCFVVSRLFAFSVRVFAAGACTRVGAVGTPGRLQRFELEVA